MLIPLLKLKHYYTPPPDILEGGNINLKSSITNPEYIRQVLDVLGISCTSAGFVNAAQIVTYYFNLNNISDFTKLNRAVKCLSADLHTQCTLTTAQNASFAIQVSKPERDLITLKQAINNDTFAQTRSYSTAVLGLDHNGQPLILDIAKLPHLMIAGATGSGKSVALNTILCSMLYCTFPARTQFVLIDPKQVELSAYEGLPHLKCPIVTNPRKAVETLASLNDIMDKRYKTMAKKRVNDISQLDLPRIIIVIDELADLMLTSKKAVEESIIRIAQLGRAAGIHLIIATQKPVVSVITGLIQGNIPCKLALQTASTGDSVRILGHKGAEQLTGKGDALLKLPDRVEEIRLQCAYTSPQDISAIVNYWKYKAKR